MRWCNHCKIYHELITSNWLQLESRSPRCRIHYNETTKRWRSANKKKVRELNRAAKLTISNKYSQFKSSANKRKLEVCISKEEYTNLVSQKCHYCDSVTAIGIDRVDNSIGYRLDNCVPACNLCNLTRNNLYTYEEFYKYIVPGIKELRNARTTTSGSTI